MPLATKLSTKRALFIEEPRFLNISAECIHTSDRQHRTYTAHSDRSRPQTMFSAQTDMIGTSLPGRLCAGQDDLLMISIRRVCQAR